jgi:hypothetical protein
MWVEDIHTMGRFLGPKGIVSDTAITASVPCKLRHDALQLGFCGPESTAPRGRHGRQKFTWKRYVDASISCNITSFHVVWAIKSCQKAICSSTICFLISHITPQSITVQWDKSTAQHRYLWSPLYDAIPSQSELPSSLTNHLLVILMAS